jgi:hypothetical protein
VLARCGRNPLFGPIRNVDAAGSIHGFCASRTLTGDALSNRGLDQIDEVAAGVFEKYGGDGAHAGGFATEGDAEGF